MSIDPAQLSKFLSFVLHHKPDAIGLALDSQDWASIEELIRKANAARTEFIREDSLYVLQTNDKKRFQAMA